jgi:hypothetical protein
MHATCVHDACTGIDRLPQFLLKYLILLVQLGGLEPPTSCSTDRRSNQLSYNCILMPPPKGGRTGRKLGATHRFGKAGTMPTRCRRRERGEA